MNSKVKEAVNFDFRVIGRCRAGAGDPRRDRIRLAFRPIASEPKAAALPANPVAFIVGAPALATIPPAIAAIAALRPRSRCYRNDLRRSDRDRAAVATIAGDPTPIAGAATEEAPVFTTKPT